MPEPTGDFITVKNHNYDLDVYRSERTAYDKYGTAILKKGPHYGKGTTHKAARIGGRLYVAENRPSRGPAYDLDHYWEFETGTVRPTSTPRMTWDERTSRVGGSWYFRAPAESTALLDTFVLLAVMSEDDSTYRPATYRYQPYQEAVSYYTDPNAIVVGGTRRIRTSEERRGTPAVTYRPDEVSRALGFDVKPQVASLKDAGLLTYRPDIRDKRWALQSVELTIPADLLGAVWATNVGVRYDKKWLIPGYDEWVEKDPIQDADGEALAEAFSDAIGS